MHSFIESTNQWGANFLKFAWPMLWQSSLLITALFALEFLFLRKLRASIRYALWLVVLVKLCVPPTLALPTSPAWWLHQTPPPVVAKPAMHYTVTYDSVPLPSIPQTPLPVFVPPTPVINLTAWLLISCVSISSALFLWLLVRWWQITRQDHRAKSSGRLTALVDEAQKIVGTKFKVQAKLTTNTMSPAVCGLFRPVILIPQSLTDNFSDEQLRAVLLHELIHLRRRDVWVNFLQALLQIFYWWHPLVWLANARIRRVREEAVDDAVMLALRDQADSYAPTLLEVAKLALNRPLASLGLVGIMESRHALRQRIERLVDFHPPRHAGVTLVSLLGILAFTAVAVPMGSAPGLAENQTLPVLAVPPVVAVQNTNADTTTVTGILTNPNFSEVMRALQQRTRAESLAEPEVTTMSSYRGINTMTMINLRVPISNTNISQSVQGGRQEIVRMLSVIRLERVAFIATPLQEVLRYLSQQAKQRDPEGKGINFMINNLSDGTNEVAILPITVNLTSTNLTLGDVLDTIVLTAEKPIKYSIQDFGIVFAEESPADIAATNTLFTRTFRVDLTTLRAGLESVCSFHGIPTFTNTLAFSPSEMASNFFTWLGVNWESPKGKAVFYIDRTGVLIVKATESDLDTIERAIQALSLVAPQIHIKARFLEVPMGTVASFGSFLNLTNSTTTNQFTGILNETNAKMILKALESRDDVETLAEPEVTTTSGRHTQMRGTQVITVVTNFAWQESLSNRWGAVYPQMGQFETGPVLDLVPYILADGYTINLTIIPSLTEFWGYATPPNIPNVVGANDRVQLPVILPQFSTRQMMANLNLWDGQTVVVGGMSVKSIVKGSTPVLGSVPLLGRMFHRQHTNETEILVFVTAEIVDPAGKRVHSDDDLPFAQKGAPPQPQPPPPHQPPPFTL